MDLEKLIDSFEKLFLECIILVVLLPKTLYKIIRSSKFGADYIEEEFKKISEDRFNEYVSPVKIILFATLSLTLFFEPTDFSLPFVYQITKDHTLFERAIIICLFYCVWPLLLSIYIVRKRKLEITLESMIKPFYMSLYNYCYIVICGVISNSIYSIIATGIKKEDASPVIFSFLIPPLLFILALIRLFQSTKYTFIKHEGYTATVATWSTIIYLVVQFAVPILLALIYVGLRGPVH
jgi:hypothetical protein